MNSYFKIIRSVLFLVSFISVFTSCKKDVFESHIPGGNEIKIDSVAFSVGTHTLLADGKSELNFIIQVYSKKTVVINGASIDSMVLVPEDRIPDSEKKVFDNTDKEVSKDFTTASITPSILSFYAKVGNTKSVVKTVNIKAPETAYNKLIIPVVFHVFELNKTDATRYPWIESMKHSKLQELVAGMNAIFNRVGTNNSNGASANVEFVLATKGPNGEILDQAGYNMFQYAGTFAWGFGTANANTLIKANAAKLLWNPKNYMNVWVLPSAVFSGGITNVRPGFTLSATPLDGVTMTKVNAITDVPLTEPVKVGLFVSRDEFYSTLRGPAPNLAFRFGIYYGLFQTYNYTWDPALSDYCDDTQVFNVNQFAKIYKTATDGILFRAENIMDATFYDFNIEGGQNIVSRLNNITSDQVKRIRYVLQNCPERMAWQ